MKELTSPRLLLLSCFYSLWWLKTLPLSLREITGSSVIVPGEMIDGIYTIVGIYGLWEIWDILKKTNRTFKDIAYAFLWFMLWLILFYLALYMILGSPLVFIQHLIAMGIPLKLKDYIGSFFLLLVCIQIFIDAKQKLKNFLFQKISKHFSVKVEKAEGKK